MLKREKEMGGGGQKTLTAHINFLFQNQKCDRGGGEAGGLEMLNIVPLPQTEAYFLNAAFQDY